MQIRPKTRDWLKGLQAELLRQRESLAPVSPTANSCLLEEGFDLTSSDYESEGEWPGRPSGRVARLQEAMLPAAGMGGREPFRDAASARTRAPGQCVPAMRWAACVCRMMCGTAARTRDVETSLESSGCEDVRASVWSPSQA